MKMVKQIKLRFFNYFKAKKRNMSCENFKNKSVKNVIFINFSNKNPYYKQGKIICDF